MKQIICVNIGQCGIRVGHNICNQMNQQHSLDQYGSVIHQHQFDKTTHQAFYAQTNDGKYMHNSIYIDTDSESVNELLVTNKVSQHQVVHAKQSASGLYSRGSCSVGRTLIQSAKQTIRHQVQRCDHLDSFIFNHAVSGGTGSGFYELVGDFIRIQYPKNHQINFTVLPSTNYSDSLIEPYNSLLTIPALHTNSDAVICFQNQKLYRFCDQFANIQNPSFLDINQVISDYVCGLTAPIRFTDSHNQFKGFQKMLVNVIPYKYFNFLHPSLYCYNQTQQQRVKLKDMIDDCYTLNSGNGKLMATYLAFQSSKINTFDIIHQLDDMRMKIHTNHRLVDWNPNPYFYTLTSSPNTKDTLSMLANDTGTTHNINIIQQKVQSLYAKRAFCYWLVQEGLEEGLITEAVEQIQILKRDYCEASALTEFNQIQ